jgi:hypothetical protein
MRETVHKGTEYGESVKAYIRADFELVAADRDRTSFTYVVTEPVQNRRLTQRRVNAIDLAFGFSATWLSMHSLLQYEWQL